MVIQCAYLEAETELFIHYSDELISTQFHIAHDTASTITYIFMFEFPCIIS